MTRRALRTSVVFLIGVFAVACSSSGNAKGPGEAVSTTTTTAATTSTTLAPITSAPPAEERAEVAVTRLLRARNETFSNPDPARVDDYLAHECPCYEQERSSLANLQSHGWRWASPMFEVLGVRVAGGKDPNLVTLTVVTRRPPERVVDSSGALAKPEGPGESPTGYSYLLSRQGGQWRIADNFKLELSQDVIQQIVAEGVSK